MLRTLAVLIVAVALLPIARAAHGDSVTTFGNTELTTEIDVAPTYGTQNLVSGT